MISRQMNDSFSEEELCLMADEIMKDVMTTCKFDPTDSPILESDEIIIPRFPSLQLTPSYHKSKSIPKTRMDLSLTPTIVSENHCKLSPYNSIDINSIPPIPHSNPNSNSFDSFEINKKWSKYNSKSETLKPQLPYIKPPTMFLSVSANITDSIADIIQTRQDITSHQFISPRPRINSRKRAQSQIPDYSKKTKHKTKRKKNKKRRHTLKRVVSPIFISFDGSNNRSNSKVKKAVQQNMNSITKSNSKKIKKEIEEENNGNEYAIEFEDKLVFVNYDD